MATLAISSVTQSTVVQSQQTGKASAAQSSTAERAPATLQPDTVKISPAAQAKLMHREGQSASVIAASLGTDVATVNSYLNITTDAQAASMMAGPSASSGHATHSASSAQSASASQSTSAAQAAPAAASQTTMPVAVS